MPGTLLGRVLGTFLLVATLGLSTCQGAFYASLPGATLATPSLEHEPATEADHG